MAVPVLTDNSDYNSPVHTSSVNGAVLLMTFLQIFFFSSKTHTQHTHTHTQESLRCVYSLLVPVSALKKVA